MGMQAAIMNATAAAFKALGDIPENVTVKHFTGDPVRDPATGTYTRPSISSPEQCIFTAISQQKWFNTVEGDVEGLMQQSQTLLTMGDTVARSGNRVYEVIDIKEDPAKATWTALLRLKKAVVS